MQGSYRIWLLCGLIACGNGDAALYHVVEHFAGHTGQIILLAKQFTPRAVRFYDDAGGLAKPLFLPESSADIA